LIAAAIYRSWLLSAALDLGALGYRVLPCRGKRPFLKAWPSLATTDPDTIRQWWEAHPRANVGLALGRGLVALDVDVPDGETSLAQLVTELGELPANTVESLTPRGGRHLLFRVPPDTIIKNAVGVRPHLDVRADGGQIVVAPSVHPEKGTRYQWRDGHGPHEREPAELPAPWLDFLARSGRPEKAPSEWAGPPSHPGSNSRQRGYGARALADESEAVARTPPGRRNDRLNRAAFAVGQLVTGGELEEPDAYATLTAAGEAAGLRPREVRATVASGLRAGRLTPRRSGTTTAPKLKPTTARDGKSVWTMVLIRHRLAVLRCSTAAQGLYLLIGCLPFVDAAQGWGGSLRQLVAALQEATVRSKNRKAVTAALKELEAAEVVWTRREGLGLRIGIGSPPPTEAGRNPTPTRKSPPAEGTLRAPDAKGGESPSPGGYPPYPLPGLDRRPGHLGARSRVKGIPNRDELLDDLFAYLAAGRAVRS
jgi:hypothetical protein